MTNVFAINGYKSTGGVASWGSEGRPIPVAAITAGAYVSMSFPGGLTRFPASGLEIPSETTGLAFRGPANFAIVRR